MYEVFTFGVTSVSNIGIAASHSNVMAFIGGLGLISGLFVALAVLWAGPTPTYYPPTRTSSIPKATRVKAAQPGDREWEKELTNKALLPGKIIWEPKVFRMRVSLYRSITEKDTAERKAQSRPTPILWTHHIT